MIDILSEDYRQIYEATESEFNLQVQKGIKNNWTKTKLKQELTKANKRSILRVKQLSSKGSQILADTIKINEKLYNSALKQFSAGILAVKRLSKTIPLREAIIKQTQLGIDKGLPIRKGGRKWSYKTYMEMNVRTTLQHEVGEKQLESGKGQVIFYVCDSFADCADDHAKYQGKMYYDERWASWKLNNKEEIAKFIKSKDLLSVQNVRENKPYLTTRPNCRHRLHAISINQALNKSVKTIIKEQKLSKGSYKPDNYDVTKQQRYNERMIRKYKERAQMNDELGFKDIVKENKRLVSKWQSRQRDLVKANGLERDYRRESNKILINDLGAKYNK